MKEINLTGRTTIISGGASGIGRQVALTFAESGSDITSINTGFIGIIIAKYKRKTLFL